jgi:hypothetical protein
MGFKKNDIDFDLSRELGEVCLKVNKISHNDSGIKNGERDD